MFCTFFQYADVSNEDYKEQFESLWECVIQQGGSLTNHSGLIDDRANDITELAGRNPPNNQDVIDATGQIESDMKAAFVLMSDFSISSYSCLDWERGYSGGRGSKFKYSRIKVLFERFEFKIVSTKSAHGNKS